MAQQKPTVFSFSIGGFMGTSYSVVMEEGVLRYERCEAEYQQEQKTTVTPTDEDWQSFSDTLDSLRVWQWQPEYWLRILDGTNWGLEIAWGDKRVKSSGCNCYPMADGRPCTSGNSTPTFDRFLVAVSKLVGGLELE